MSKHGKQYREVAKLVEQGKRYLPEEAVDLVKKAHYVKFDPSVEVHVVFNLDPNKADQQLRGTVALPHGTGKTQRILVFTQGDKVQDAKDVGADYVGGADLIEKIKGGWFEFDLAIASPDMMPEVGKIAKIIGTKGLMPNPKAGTVTPDVGRAVAEFKKGRIEYRLEKRPIVHVAIGKASFSPEQLLENLQALFDAFMKNKPKGAKGQYIKGASMNATMGPGIALDASKLQ